MMQNICVHSHLAKSGNLYTSPKNWEEAEKVNLNIQQEEGSGLWKIEKNINIVELNNKSPWTKSIEPEEHIKELLDTHNFRFKDKLKILCFSYKDYAVVQGLMKKGKKIDIDLIYDGEFTHAEDDNENLACEKIKMHKNKKYDIIIMRHYLEHYWNPTAILNAFLEMMDAETSVIIEVPSCEKFFSENNPLFAWEQHKVYFDRNSFSNIITHIFGEKWILKEYDYPLENSLVAIVDSRINEVDSRTQVQYPEFSLSEQELRDYFKQWMKMIDSKRCKDIIGFGVGHTFDRMMQETKIFETIKKVYDGNKAKSGKYLYGFHSPIEYIGISELAKIDCDIVMGVHPRTKSSISNQLRRLGFKNKIFGIYNAKESER